MNVRNPIWEWLQLAVITAMFATAAIRWQSLPERLPVHWNASGQVDGYGGKFEGLLLLPLIAVGVYLLLRYLPRIDPARANYAGFAGTYLLLRIVILVYFGFFYLVMNLALGESDAVPFEQLVFGGISVLFIVLGSMMGKFRPNWFAGIRTPWTLSSKTSWTRTHRLGGWVFIVAGVATLVASLFSGIAATVTMLVVILPGVVFLVAYSYFVWRDDPDRVPAQETTPIEDA
jgi:uncharacterized membrane protein